jgi:proline iminopeptidase
VGRQAVTEAEAGAWLNEFEALERQGAYFFCSMPNLPSESKAGHEESTEESTMDSHSGSIAAGGFQLRSQIEGAGIPTIVIGSARKEPRLFSQHLWEHLRLVFLDHRGFAVAPSPIDQASFALETLVDDIEYARHALGLERVAVMGHSGHADMALEYGKKYAAHVSHVVMIGSAPDLSTASQQAAEGYWQESVCPERKAVLQANLQRLPDDALARLPAANRARQARLRNAPKI